MKCPHCGKTINRAQAAAAMGSVTSEAKAAASASNGRGWQRPHFVKVEHFLALGLLEGLVSNEHKFKFKLADGSLYNPDFYQAATDCYIEVATSRPNISTQKSKWKRAMKRINLRVFWWEGEEITHKLGGRPKAAILPSEGTGPK